MDWSHPLTHTLRCAQPLQLGELTSQLLESSLELAFGNVCLHVNTCVTWIQSLAPSRLYPHRPPSQLGLPSVEMKKEELPGPLLDTIAGGTGSWQIYLLLAPAPQEAALEVVVRKQQARQNGE